MMTEKQIRVLLSDLRSVYAVGYFRNDLDSESEKWSQIEMLEYILSHKGVSA